MGEVKHVRNNARVNQVRRRVVGFRMALKWAALGALLAGLNGCASVRFVSAPSDAADAMMCGACGGKGKVAATCRVCGGQGYVTTSAPGLRGPVNETLPCKACLKSESLDKKEMTVCPRCQGTGRVYRCDSSGNRLP